MKYDLRHIRVFLSVAEELHFSNAAKKLNLAQPVVSRTLRELEAELGVELFHRSTRSVELTDAGRCFLTETKIAVDQLTKAVSLARRTAAGVAGRIRVGYNDFAMNGTLPSMLRSFRDSHPRIQIELSFHATRSQQIALLEDRIDVGFMIGGMNDERMRSHHCFSEPLVALLPEDHPLARRRKVSLAELARCPFVLGSDDNWNAFRSIVNDVCRANGIALDIVQEASSSEGIFGLVAAGIGVTAYAKSSRTTHRNGIVERPIADVSEKIPTCAVWPIRLSSGILGTFTEFVADFYAPRNVKRRTSRRATAARSGR